MAKPRYVSFVWRYLKLILLKRNLIGRTLEELAARQGERPCVIFEDETVSYDALNRRANRRANLFGGMGLGKGDAICLLMENRPEYLETVVGIAKLGGVTALINHNLKGPSLAHCIEISGADRIIVGLECLEALAAVLPELKRVRPEGVYVDTRHAEYNPPVGGMHDLNTLLAGASEANPQGPPMRTPDPFLFIYTSGTTGLPKAARVNHYRWYGAGLAFGYYGLLLTPQDVVYCPLPLYHSNGILIAFGAALVNGAALAVSRRFSATRFWPEVHRYGATSMIYIGELLRYLVNQAPLPEERGHRMSRILGNGLRPDIWPAFHERFDVKHIREFYASTEGNAVTLNLDDVPGSVGKAVLRFSDNTVLVRYDVEADGYVRDARGFCVRCGPGEVGEMLGKVKVTTPFYGYTSEEDTRKKILRDVFAKGDAYFRTGDLMRQDGEGFYYFVDRIGDTYRWKGENVATQEVQEILGGFPGTNLVSVYGVQVAGADGRVGMAAIHMKAGQSLDAQAFYRHAVGRLAPFAVPAFVRLVEEMDMTGTFKLRKTELQAQGFDPAQVAGALFWLDREGETYRPLEQETFRRIQAGELRF